MCGTFIGRSAQIPAFIKPKWYDMSKSNSIVIGNEGNKMNPQFVFGEENRNILVRGGTGKGKTGLMKQLLTLVMADNQQATVLDGDGEYKEYEKMGAHIITFTSKDSFLSQTEIETCKQSDVVIIDEGLRLYSNNPEGFTNLLEELEELNVRVFVSFQAIPEELLHRFDVYLELDPLIA
ncbi:type IV secretion system DNA-binding domain-containing protein [Bacillus mycoides]|uniref:type IV secretion system DNA-binding domain-containing protein n=1 Tax=Bacillus mycoides TaxID=1405 RepID=UPI003CFDE226